MKLKNLAFEIGDRVKIIELNIKGRIAGIYINSKGATYKVRYFFDSKPNEVYFEDSELELTTDEKVPVNPLNPNK